MRFLFLLLITFIAWTPDLYAQNDPIEQYKWKNRVLLVFGASYDDPLIRTQDEIINSDKGGFDERGVVVTYIHSADRHGLARRYKVPENTFAVILIGKDGERKETWLEPVEAEEIFIAIDIMPMRQREIMERQ